MTRAELARLLYTLLDAAAEENRLLDPAAAERWLAIKARFDNARSEQHCASLEDLFDEVDRTGVLVGTWIEARWLAAKARSAGVTKTRLDARPAGGARAVPPLN